MHYRTVLTHCQPLSNRIEHRKTDSWGGVDGEKYERNAARCWDERIVPGKPPMIFLDRDVETSIGFVVRRRYRIHLPRG